MIDYDVKMIPGMGRGLVIRYGASAGQVICMANTWSLPMADQDHLAKTSMSGEYFEHNGALIVCLGDVSLLNHSADPNAEVVFQDTDVGVRVLCVATRDILAGQQVFIDYGEQYWESREAPL